MPLFLLLTLIVLACLITQNFILLPLSWLPWLSLPKWLMISFFGAVIIWCLGD